MGADEILLPFVDGAARRARFEVEPMRSPGPSATGRELLAGAAEVDITPPPGMPKAGYSANAHDGNGFRTRLRARVVHLRSGTTSLAVVQCDLLGGSAVVHHLVARAIADTDVRLPGLLIGATHTHAGPGQFLGTDFYNRFASNRSGFDPAFAQFLVDRIAGGVRQAVATRRPARLAWGSAEVWGLTRNRSLEPHVRNEEVTDKRTDAHRKYVAVNPWLHVLRVDAAAGDGGSEPLAALAVFSVHGTGISMRAREYNADVWAYLVGELGDRIERATGTRPVVGALQGTHADVAPNIRPASAGYVEARRVGRAMGGEAGDLWERLDGQLTGDVELAAGLREVDLDVSPSIDGVELPRPAVGAALVAGAHENTTPVVHRIPPFRAGSGKRFPTSHPQGAKWVLASRWLQPVVLPSRSFPRVLPLQVLRIGPVALLGLPFELTVETGARIQAAGRDALAGTGVDRVVATSVANEYAGYAATAEEYALQHYEGGHTLYGPATERFLTNHVARLARDLARTGWVDDALRMRRFDLKVRRYLARPGSTVGIERQVLGTPSFTDQTSGVDGYWELRWRDVAPGDLEWHEPLVRIEALDHGAGGRWQPAVHGGRPADDQGWDLEVVHMGHERDGHRYAARWYNPSVRAGRRHRFVLVANAGRREVVSEPFD